MRKFVASGLIASLLVAVVGAYFNYDHNFSNSAYSLAGLGYVVFGIWASVLLLRHK